MRNADGRAWRCELPARGGVSQAPPRPAESASVSPRKIVETALSVNAASVILAHNHPGGFAFPSDDDVLTTKRIALALDTVGIVLADHIVVAEGDYVSMAQSGCCFNDYLFLWEAEAGG